MIGQALVLDADILIRAVLGRRALDLISRHQDGTAFFAADESFADAAKYLPPIFARRGLDWAIGAAVLNQLPALVQSVDHEVYAAFEAAARRRIRDQRDWPVLATALALNCPIWTEDADFFGSGVATWTTGTVSLYLAPPPPQPS